MYNFTTNMDQYPLFRNKRKEKMQHLETCTMQSCLPPRRVCSSSSQDILLEYISNQWKSITNI